MNLMLFVPEEVEEGVATLSGRRLEHMRGILKSAAGDNLRCGVRGGLVGMGTVLEIGPERARMRLQLDREPPPLRPLVVVLALPRPRVVRRMMQTAVELGVQHLVILHSNKVEKSYWQSPVMAPEALDHALVLGMEQARTTRAPRVQLAKRFKPFVEDELPALAEGRRALVAHPSAAHGRVERSDRATIVAIGPEGGFDDYELGKLVQAGLEPVVLGAHILRTETALPFLVGALMG